MALYRHALLNRLRTILNELLNTFFSLKNFFDYKSSLLSISTILQREPVLSSKKLDLYKIYRMVIANGGCEKICSEKAWKKICEPFSFPQTCTNSAYVMKNVYIR